MFIFRKDGYKVGHPFQYPWKTERVDSNWTARKSRIEGVDKVVFYGLQRFLMKRMMAEAGAWFALPTNAVTDAYKKFLDSYLGPDHGLTVDHIKALHEYGKIPLEYWALPEGTRVPLRVPMFTVNNTHPDFGWVTNSFETLTSEELWVPCTSATKAYHFRKMLDGFVAEQDGPMDFVPWMGHDFSMRGMASDASEMSGMGHLLSFTGTDSIPSIFAMEDYYGDGSYIGGSVAATEHSVMCTEGPEGEFENIKRLITEVQPNGIISIVCDTYNLWRVITVYLPLLKDIILARNGTVVIRPDSGVPADIICGDPNATDGDAYQGAMELLWGIFGGTETSKGFRILDSHISLIYGDSIGEENGQEIGERLAAKGFAYHMVLGLGSFFYQHVTRDTFGFAMKATNVVINGEERAIWKDPITDNGEKKSAVGRIAVQRGEDGELFAIDGLSTEEFNNTPNEMVPVWRDGELLVRHSVSKIRERLHPALVAA